MLADYFAADLRSLARLIPAQSRLVLDPGATPPAGTTQTEKAADLAPGAELASVPTAAVRAGDLLRVLPGERVPVDGELVTGQCSVDESMLTGEAALVPKGPGMQVSV